MKLECLLWKNQEHRDESFLKLTPHIFKEQS